jgi:hypothetical protein
VSDPLLSVKERLASAAAVPALELSVKRHCENLEALAQTLKTLGLDDREINSNVVAVFEEYERELLNTVGEMMRSEVR